MQKKRTTKIKKKAGDRRTQPFFNNPITVLKNYFAVRIVTNLAVIYSSTP